MTCLRFIIRSYLALSILYCFLETSECLQNGSARGRSAHKFDQTKTLYSGLSNANGDYQMKQLSSGRKNIEAKGRQGGGIGLSAWGIIGVLGGSLLLGTVLYYAMLFYPILCKKERKCQDELMVDYCPTAPPPALSTPV